MSFEKTKSVLTNKHTSIHTSRRALQCNFEPILVYGCDAWIISKQLQKNLEVIEMWFLQRMLRISWTTAKSKETVFREVDTRSLKNRIRKRQATFFGHVMRKEELPYLVSHGVIEGKHTRRKEREKWMDGLNIERVTCTRSEEVSRCLECHDHLRLCAVHLIDFFFMLILVNLYSFLFEYSHKELKFSASLYLTVYHFF